MDDTQEKVTAVCLEALELSELAPDANLTEAGMDSLSAVQIMQRVEELYGTDVLEALIDKPTIAHVAEAIRVSLNQG